MRNATLLLSRLRADRRALTALEYGIIAGWLAFTIVAIFVRLGTSISNLFAPVTSSI